MTELNQKNRKKLVFILSAFCINAIIASIMVFIVIEPWIFRFVFLTMIIAGLIFASFKTKNAYLNQTNSADINMSSPSFFEQQQLANNTTNEFTTSSSNYQPSQYQSPNIDIPNYDMSPSYSHLSSNIFNHNK